jgi:hypothetical protein
MTLTQVAATILSFIALTASLEVCPTGFSLTSLRDHSLCLYPSSTPHNKKNAETFCHNLGGALFVAREGSDIPFQNTKIESSASHLWVNTDHTESYNTARGPDVNFTEVYHKQANEEEAGQRASCWSLQRGVLTATDCSNEHKALCSAVPVISQGIRQLSSSYLYILLFVLSLTDLHTLLAVFHDRRCVFRPGSTSYGCSEHSSTPRTHEPESSLQRRF